MTHSMNRRTMMAGAAAIPAAGLPAFALASAGTDPAFAAIANFERAHSKGENGLLVRADEIETALHDRATAIADAEVPEEKHLRAERSAKMDAVRAAGAVWDGFRDDDYFDSRHNEVRRAALSDLEDAPEHEEVERLRDESYRLWRDAIWALADTVPTTAAGSAALVKFYSNNRYAHDLSVCARRLGDDDEDAEETLAEAIMVSLATFAHNQAA